MITKLNNFTHKSFVDYTNPKNLLFCNKNILFGYNGKGKSSITIGIKNEFLKNPIKNRENLRVFDRDYISTSLLLENTDGKIKGIEASFGKGVVDIENKVKELENKIIIKEEIDKLDSNIVRLRSEIRNDIDTIHNRRKGKSNIQKKAKDESVKRVIELYKKDFTEAKKIEIDDDKLIEINGDNSIEKQISQNENLQPLSFSNISTALLVEVNIIFKEKFGEDISIPEYEIVQWIESGIKIHKEGDNCKFCNNKLDYSNIKSKITHYKENKRHKATIKLKQFREQLQFFLASINTIQKETKNYSTNLGNEVDQYFTTINENGNDIQSLINSCQSKIEKIEIQENFDFELLAGMLQKIEDSIVNINKIKNEQLSELRKKLNNLTTLVKGAIGLEITKSVSIKNKLKDIEIKEGEIKNKRENNIKIQKKIQDLKKQKSLTKDFADFVSQILSDINISLKVTLDSDNRNYIIISTNENATLTIKDISEGEKNLLALLFFYFELFVDNKQLQIKPEIELIIVDDPISSMDDSNKFYILELMKSLLELTSQQIFIMTHSWEDYCNLSYGKVNNQSFATFELRKNKGLSDLAKLTTKEKPYKYLFKEIYEFSRKSDEDLKSECQIYHYPNVMRRIFEEWYGFKLGKNLNFTSNLQKQTESHFKITSTNEKRKLGLLIKVCNILSHSINGSMNPEEIHHSAKYLMNLISKNDKLHFDNMKQ